MNDQNPNPVVVAVGHDSINGALAFAAGEALRAGCGLHLVHVVQPAPLSAGLLVLPQGRDTPLVAEADHERAGQQVLDGALEWARDLGEGVPVTTELRVGGIVPTLVEVAKDARMIVLERRELARMMRVVTRSVSSGVAARARVPVVSVPARWSPARIHGGFPTVTVGVDVPERAQLVMQAAAAEAKSRGAVLHVIHTWNFPTEYDDLILTRAESEEWAARATAEIQIVIDGLGDDFARVPVQIHARGARAADALIEASAETELLVIGRHDPLVPIGSHMGPIARAVLREADCPVLLVDPRPAHGRKRHSRRSPKTAAQPV